MSETINTNTTTQIRNLYSDGMSYMNIKFFNTNLSFSLYPFISKDNLGKSSYDMKNGQVTTVNFEGAAALELTIEDIINGKLVLGKQKEIQEVKNAYKAYGMMKKVDPYSIEDLKMVLQFHLSSRL